MQRSAMKGESEKEKEEELRTERHQRLVKCAIMIDRKKKI